MAISKEVLKTEYQHMMASMLDSKYEEITVTRKDIAEVFPEVIYYAIT